MASLPKEEYASCNGIEICYQQFGPADGDPLIFIMGLGAQMVFWPLPLITDLAARGYRVIRFDNRDIGHSQKLRSPDKSGSVGTILRYLTRQPVKALYDVHDMVNDTLGLMDHLQLEKAHVIGASMGGMIAQLMAANHPQRVKSLTSIMSNTNNPWLLPSKPSAMLALIGPRKIPQTEEEAVVSGRDIQKRIGGKLPHGEMMDRILAESFHRGLYPRGVKQQFMAIMATGDFTRQLRKISCPTTVIHGASDPLLRPAGGKASARAIKGARLELIKEMGHDLPPAVLPKIADLIDTNVKKAV